MKEPPSDDKLSNLKAQEWYQQGMNLDTLHHNCDQSQLNQVLAMKFEEGRLVGALGASLKILHRLLEQQCLTRGTGWDILTLK